MRIGIVTLPLHSNYGGILQNYALQQVLKRLGHTPITIDLIPCALWQFVLSTCKTIVMYFIPERKRPFAHYHRTGQMQAFVEKYIVHTHLVSKYSVELLDEYRIEGLIVGSDQVWRPRYVRWLDDMFLRFTRHTNMRKVTYAASFGVDTLEFSERQLQRCVPLLQQFYKVSVREASGVDLCRNYFHVNAEHVLDPTLLLSKDDYEQVCISVPKHSVKFLACYILDPTKEQRRCIDRMAQYMNLAPIYFTVNGEGALSVEEWLAMFRDTDCVVTDSFHGTVFSIIFRKPFITIVNEARGGDRFVTADSRLRVQVNFFS